MQELPRRGPREAAAALVQHLPVLPHAHDVSYAGGHEAAAQRQGVAGVEHHELDALEILPSLQELLELLRWLFAWPTLKCVWMSSLFKGSTTVLHAGLVVAWGSRDVVTAQFVLHP